MSEALTIHHDQAGHQFETTVDGHRAYLTYMDLGKQTLDIYRTFVPNALRGRGIAAALTERALEYARSKAGGMRRYDEDTAVRRLVGQLSRRGYAGSIALTAARTAWRETQRGSGVGRVRFEES